MSLERFQTAQASEDSGFETALKELRAGRKTSHWIWYIFPQLVGLGRSSTARYYGLADLAEAQVYLKDSVLRGRLLRTAEAVAEQLAQGVSLEELMGGQTDSLKLVSSLTLFEHVAGSLAGEKADPEIARLADLCTAVLGAAESQGYPRCGFTLRQFENPPIA